MRPVRLPLRVGICLFLVAVAQVDAPAAFGHGLTGEATNKSTLGYTPLGIEHMLLGWDHLLFVLGIVLLADAPGRAAKLISLFVVGHSTTLIVATLSEWRVSPSAVDVVIALSVVFIGVLGLRGRPKNWFFPGLVILGFGLVHGLGLSSRLQALGIPDDGLLGKTIAFNIGIEIGQLLAVVVMAGVIWLLARAVTRWPARRRYVFGAIAIAGSIAAAVLSFPDEGGRERVLAGAAEACKVGEPIGFANRGGEHPAKRFYGPEEEAPEEDLGHVLGDGFVIVRYRPNLPRDQIAGLRSWIDGLNKAIAAAPDPEQKEALTATTIDSAARCDEYDLPALQRYAGDWFAQLRAGRMG